MTKDRFRFRVWNKTEKVYLKMPEMHCDNTSCFLSVMEDEVLEQCTGLKDKNGRLIYEGDIVFYGGVELWWVVFEEKYCSFELLRKDGNGLSMSAHKEMTVVGNIHENPELLENKK